jgi:hypothetical protein
VSAVGGEALDDDGYPIAERMSRASGAECECDVGLAAVP